MPSVRMRSSGSALDIPRRRGDLYLLAFAGHGLQVRLRAGLYQNVQASTRSVRSRTDLIESSAYNFGDADVTGLVRPGRHGAAARQGASRVRRRRRRDANTPHAGVELWMYGNRVRPAVVPPHQLLAAPRSRRLTQSSP